MKICKYDNSLMTEQKQSVIIGANCIRTKQRFTIGRIQHAPTVKDRERKNVKKYCHFCALLLPF